MDVVPAENVEDRRDVADDVVLHRDVLATVHGALPL